MLSHRLQLQRVTMEQFYTMLLGVVEVLNECRHYMLRPEGCLLDDQYLFVGEELSDIAIAYVPLKEIDKGRSGYIPGIGSLMPLVVRWTAYVDALDGDGLQRILQHLNGRERPLAELRTTLLELIGRQITAPVKETPIQFVHEYIRPEPAIEPEVESRQNWSEDLPPYEFDSEKNEAPATNTRKWLLSAAILLAVACAWRYLYMPNMAKGGFLMSAGLSVTGLVGLAVIWLKGQKERDLFAREPDEFIPISLPLGELSGGLRKFPVVSSLSGPISSSYLEQAAAASTGYTFTTAPKVHTAAPEPTVLLGKEGRDSSAHGQSTAWLQREWKGEQTKLSLTESKHTIGRAGENVSYEDAAEGISRMHLEVERMSGEVYQVKDLGSRNGTLLNGQTMIPYKAYKLEAEDILQLAGTSGPKYVLKR